MQIRALILFAIMFAYPLTSSTVGEEMPDAVEVDLTQQVECRSTNMKVLERIVINPSLVHSDDRFLQVQYFQQLEPSQTARCKIVGGKYDCQWRDNQQLQLSLTEPVVEPLGDRGYRVKLAGQYLKNYKVLAQLSCIAYSF
ncbi:MAG: hypothetical protein H6626_13160 [Pseudobdellovibrionaceae bacterium]|nr:MAG: hypothetical protein H6626_13160 [Pseudobdellovibrionaceae bacterium]